jgi:outer membrane protein assembly factor BamB
MRLIGVAVVSLGVLTLSSLPIGAAGDNWPQWRGPAGRGVSDAAGYPDEWSPDKHIAWKTPIAGRGHSSPVVWNDRVFLTSSIEGERVPGHTAPDHLGYDLRPGYLHPDSVGVEYRNALKVVALDAGTGRIVWERTAYDGLMYDNRHRKNTYASSTPVTDGRLVYAYFEAAGIYAYDFDGALVWSSSLGKMAKAGMGPGTSPILFEDLVIVQADQEMGAGSAMVALDKRTGKEVWRTARTTRRSWATPLVVEANKRVELVAAGAEMVAGYDPRSGRELWRSRGTESHPIPSAVAGLGLIFFTAGSQAKRAMAVRPGGEGDVTGSAIVWSYRKGTAYVPSPILHGSFLYLMTDAGLMTCLDAATGEVKYEGGRPPVPATFTSSLVAYGDRLLMTSEDGDTFVVKAGPAYEVLRTNTVGEPVYASLALANSTIFIRGAQHLFAVRSVRLLD